MNREEVIEIESTLLRGIKISDVNLLAKLLHDDLLFIAPTGQIVTKEMDLASHRAGDMKVEELIATVEEVNIIGDTATVVVVYKTKGTMLGTPMEGRFRYIRIWKKFSDGFKVIGGSCFKIQQ